MTTTIAEPSIANFLKQYAKPSDKGRFFTKSQLFIAYRAYLSRKKSSALSKFKTTFLFVYNVLYFLNNTKD